MRFSYFRRNIRVKLPLSPQMRSKNTQNRNSANQSCDTTRVSCEWFEIVFREGKRKGEEPKEMSAEL
jgi:hypothetical protein